MNTVMTRSEPDKCVTQLHNISISTGALWLVLPHVMLEKTKRQADVLSRPESKVQGSYSSFERRDAYLICLNS